MRFPIVVTELGIVMLVRPEQNPKALSPIVVTEFGIVMLVKSLQVWNAPIPIEVTVYVAPALVTVDGILILPEYVPKYGPPVTATSWFVASVTL